MKHLFTRLLTGLVVALALSALAIAPVFANGNCGESNNGVCEQAKSESVVVLSSNLEENLEWDDKKVEKYKAQFDNKVDKKTRQHFENLMTEKKKYYYLQQQYKYKAFGNKPPEKRPNFKKKLYFEKKPYVAQYATRRNGSCSSTYAQLTG